MQPNLVALHVTDRCQYKKCLSVVSEGGDFPNSRVPYLSVSQSRSEFFGFKDEFPFGSKHRQLRRRIRITRLIELAQIRQQSVTIHWHLNMAVVDVFDLKSLPVGSIA